MTLCTHFTGTIVEIDAAGGIAIVDLHEEINGLKEAVISANTEGRVVLMNGRGELEVDTQVVGTGLSGVDAIVATSIKKKT